MNSIKKIDDFVPQKGEIVFFDTNIWLNLYVPTGRREDKTTKLIIGKVNKMYKQLLEKEAVIYTSSLVISEFCNRYLRLMFDAEYSRTPEKYPERNYKKEFKGTEEYREHLSDLIMIVRENILNGCKRIDDDFSKFEIEAFEETEINAYFDFNDFYINEICKKKNYKIITCDKDFVLANRGNDVVWIN